MNWLTAYLADGFRRRYLNRSEIPLFKLHAQRRHVAGHVNIDGHRVHYVDAASCFSAWKSIFRDQIYRFTTDLDSPQILDCGANIGLGILYWNKLFQQPRILAFEPDPEVFSTLQRNCAGFDSVQLFQQALAGKSGSIDFFASCDDAGTTVATGQQNQPAISVQAVTLSEVMSKVDGRVDLLKIDIEGAETDVLVEAKSELSRVDRIFVEYHGFADQKQTLTELLTILKDSGFRYHLCPEYSSARPMVQVETELGMDQRINVFGIRSSLDSEQKNA